MNESELINILDSFKDYLNIANLFSDPFRLIGWIIITGISWLVDGLEGVTNKMLLVKDFFQNPEIVAFVQSIKPLLYILMAFSILYSGYLIMFQRKIQKEAIAINLIIALAIISILSSGMDQANTFTDEAISAVNNGDLFENANGGTISENIISLNTTDLVELDKNGWSSTEKHNSIPLNMMKQLKITERFDKEKLNISNEDVSKNYLTWSGDEITTEKFDQGGMVDWNNEYYYRYDLNWLTIISTLLVIGFTLFSISYKLARLSFELTFNYILAILIAPADLHDGQKTKKILQSILNTFLVVILIFLSIKIYIIGTSYLANNYDGLVYIIALLGFSVALIDGPNMVERLFGIDAGLKNGWSVLAGGYGMAKAAKGLTNGISSLFDKSGDSEKGKDEKADGKKGDRNRSPLSQREEPSPFTNANDKDKGKESANDILNNSDDKNGENKLNEDANKDADSTGSTNEISDIASDNDKENSRTSNLSNAASVVSNNSNKGMDSKNSTTGSGAVVEGDNATNNEATSQNNNLQQQSSLKDQETGEQQTSGMQMAKNSQAQVSATVDGATAVQATPSMQSPLTGNGATTEQQNLQQQSSIEQQAAVTETQNIAQKSTKNSQGQVGASVDGATATQATPSMQSPLTGNGATTEQQNLQQQSSIEQQAAVTETQNIAQKSTKNSQGQVGASVDGATATQATPSMQSPLTSNSATTEQLNLQQQSTLGQQTNLTETQNINPVMTKNSQAQAGATVDGTTTQATPSMQSPLTGNGATTAEQQNLQQQSNANQQSNVTEIHSLNENINRNSEVQTNSNEIGSSSNIENQNGRSIETSSSTSTSSTSVVQHETVTNETNVVKQETQVNNITGGSAMPKGNVSEKIVDTQRKGINKKK